METLRESGSGGLRLLRAKPWANARVIQAGERVRPAGPARNCGTLEIKRSEAILSPLSVPPSALIACSRLLSCSCSQSLNCLATAARRCFSKPRPRKLLFSCIPSLPCGSIKTIETPRRRPLLVPRHLVNTILSPHTTSLQPPNCSPHSSVERPPPLCAPRPPSHSPPPHPSSRETRLQRGYHPSPPLSRTPREERARCTQRLSVSNARIMLQAEDALLTICAVIG